MNGNDVQAALLPSPALPITPQWPAATQLLLSRLFESTPQFKLEVRIYKDEDYLAEAQAQSLVWWVAHDHLCRANTCDAGCVIL